MIRCLLIFQKPHEVHSILTGFFQLSAGKNAALVSVSHYLEYHSRVGDRFSSSGRIRCVQFPVVQFLKLGAGHSDGCILWQFNFTIQYDYQLIILLRYAILSLRFRVFHGSLILTQKITSANPFWDGRCGFFIGRFLQHALALAFVILAHQNCRLTVVSLNSFLITVKPTVSGFFRAPIFKCKQKDIFLC